MRRQVGWLGTLIVALIAGGRGVCAEPAYCEPPQDCFLKSPQTREFSLYKSAPRLQIFSFAVSYNSLSEHSRLTSYLQCSDQPCSAPAPVI